MAAWRRKKGNSYPSFDDRKLEVVRLEGRVDRLLAEAVAENPDEASRIIEATR